MSKLTAPCQSAFLLSLKWQKTKWNKMKKYAPPPLPLLLFSCNFTHNKYHPEMEPLKSLPIIEASFNLVTGGRNPTLLDIWKTFPSWSQIIVKFFHILKLNPDWICLSAADVLASSLDAVHTELMLEEPRSVPPVWWSGCANVHAPCGPWRFAYAVRYPDEASWTFL